MTNLHHILCLLLTTALISACGVSTESRLWNYGQSHPEGFTLNVETLKEPAQGIAAAYEGESVTEKTDLSKIMSHARRNGGYVGGWKCLEDGRLYFESVRLFPEDSLDAAIGFGKANHQRTLYRISTGEEILLIEDMEFVSPNTLIIIYDAEVGKDTLLQAVKDYGAEILYEYNIIPGIAIKIPSGAPILEAIDYFDKVKGVTAVERDHIYHLTDPVKPALETR